MAESGHYNKIRRHHLAEKCGTCSGNISRVMGSMDNMRKELIEYALENGRYLLVAQAIFGQHESVRDLTSKQKEKILKLSISKI